MAATLIPRRTQEIFDHLRLLYDAGIARATTHEIEQLIERYRPHLVSLRPPRLTEKDAMLITYGDMVREPTRPPLQTLADFCRTHLADVLTSVHILPFYPSTSDDGFSVVDYKTVDPALGDWHDVAQLGHQFRPMFDAVINHVSASSEWFRAFLRDDPEFRDWFVVSSDGADLSKVVRPRALPLLTKFRTTSGEKAVWTTFSEDQVDLNYRNPRVLIEVLDTLLFYVAHGAEFLRLDAIAFLWKQDSTTCLHLPQTHRVIRLIRTVIDSVAPWVELITETNVPHKDNVSYFGDGDNEAHLVYNFALPPLTLHALLTGRADVLSRWAGGLTLPSSKVTFFNFLASHDGIGLNPARGILPEAEIQGLVARVQARGGLVSLKNNPDGSQSPYELNVNYFDALADPDGNEPITTQIARFMTAQSILLTMIGLPGIYFHSLFGSRGWPEGVKQTGRNRTINRQKLDRVTVEQALADPTSLRHRVIGAYRRLLQARASSPAFDPFGSQRVIDCGPAVYGLLRASADDAERILCLHNVTSRPQPVSLELRPLFGRDHLALGDLLGGPAQRDGSRLTMTLSPYQVAWLAPAERSVRPSS